MTKGYVSETTGQLRYAAPRGFRWDREGIHAPVGAAVAGLLWRRYRDEAFVALVLFLAYEISEGYRIKDGAFRDIGAAAFGYGAVVGARVGLDWLRRCCRRRRRAEDSTSGSMRKTYGIPPMNWAVRAWKPPKSVMMKKDSVERLTPGAGE